MLYPLSYGGATSIPTRRSLNTFVKRTLVFKMSRPGGTFLPKPAGRPVGRSAVPARQLQPRPLTRFIRRRGPRPFPKIRPGPYNSGMSNRRRVVVTDFITGDLGPERQILGELADLVALDACSEDDLRGHVEDADALMLYHNIQIRRPTIERLGKCKLIVRCGVGYDNVDHVFARSRAIPVANVPDYGTEEVADSAIGLTL